MVCRKLATCGCMRALLTYTRSRRLRAPGLLRLPLDSCAHPENRADERVGTRVFVEIANFRELVPVLFALDALGLPE